MKNIPTSLQRMEKKFYNFGHRCQVPKANRLKTNLILLPNCLLPLIEVQVLCQGRGQGPGQGPPRQLLVMCFISLKQRFSVISTDLKPLVTR
jgi:hypothetical protein